MSDDNIDLKKRECLEGVVNVCHDLSSEITGAPGYVFFPAAWRLTEYKFII